MVDLRITNHQPESDHGSVLIYPGCYSPERLLAVRLLSLKHISFHICVGDRGSKANRKMCHCTVGDLDLCV